MSQTSNFALHFCLPERVVLTHLNDVGFNDKGKKTLAHPDYHMIQSMWHPTLYLGKLPADFTHKSRQQVWLCCPGCIHACGRRHEWEPRIYSLTRRGGQIDCPYCYCGSGGFCQCRSVEEDPRLLREWHPTSIWIVAVSARSWVHIIQRCTSRAILSLYCGSQFGGYAKASQA